MLLMAFAIVQTAQTEWRTQEEFANCNLVI